MGRLGIGEKRMSRPRRADEPGHAAEGRDRQGAPDEPGAAAAGRADHGPGSASKLDVQAFIEELQADHDATIVLTTHDLAEAERLAGESGSWPAAGSTAEGTPAALKTRRRNRARRCRRRSKACS